MLRNLQSLTFKRAYISVFQASQIRAFGAEDKSNYERTKDQATQAWEKVKDKAASNITEDKGADVRGSKRMESSESQRATSEKDLIQENLDNKFKDFQELKARVDRDPLMEGGQGEASDRTKGMAGRVIDEAKDIGGKVSEKASEIGQKASDIGHKASELGHKATEKA